ncbi:hypothetical protein SAMD00024442_6_77 [Candidatus Symbiothrix dinenymphae]|nr:hypothetical protein SAMD00024442_6_77 [Candidatus Symbiothrix dinenymphae]
MVKLMNLKHWQVFAILMGVPVIAPLAVFCQVVANSRLTTVSTASLMDIGNNYLAKMLAVLPCLTAVSIGLLAVWFSAMAVCLHKKLPPTAKMSLAGFWFCLLFPAVFKVVTAIWLPDLIAGFWNSEPHGHFFIFPQIFPTICAFLLVCAQPVSAIVAHLMAQFAMSYLLICLYVCSAFCIFYCFYFIAKALKTAELQRPVKFRDFAQEFFLIWILPVGIWIIQPRINQLFNKK